MGVSLVFIRSFFLMLSVLLSTFYFVANSEKNNFYLDILMGISYGTLLSLIIFGIDYSLKKFNLRTFNIIILGLFFGYLLSQVLLVIISGLVDINLLPNGSLIKSFIYLSSIYLGMIMTARSASDFYMCIPFFKFKSQLGKKRALLLDESILLDSRFIELASSGLLDNRLLIPKFMIHQFNTNLENENENIRNQSKKALDAIKKLETLKTLELKYTERDFFEAKNCSEKLVKLAKISETYILIGENDSLQEYLDESIKIIKFNDLCNALKPLSQCGENITIKIQRIGKEPRQGIGYLEDGTMVVVNGGAKFIEQTISAQVLSVKRTTSGRIMIFCNAIDGFSPEHIDSSFSLSASPYAINNEEDFLEPIPNKYFTL